MAPLWGESTGHVFGEFFHKGSVTQNFDIFFDVRLDKQLNKE